MNLKEEFEQKWCEKFTDKPPPNVECLEGQGRNEIEKTLTHFNTTIANLNQKLLENQFIADFLWEVLHTLIENDDYESDENTDEEEERGDYEMEDKVRAKNSLKCHRNYANLTTRSMEALNMLKAHSDSKKHSRPIPESPLDNKNNNYKKDLKLDLSKSPIGLYDNTIHNNNNNNNNDNNNNNIIKKPYLAFIRRSSAFSTDLDSSIPLPNSGSTGEVQEDIQGDEHYLKSLPSPFDSAPPLPPYGCDLNVEIPFVPAFSRNQDEDEDDRGYYNEPKESNYEVNVIYNSFDDDNNVNNNKNNKDNKKNNGGDYNDIINKSESPLPMPKPRLLGGRFKNRNNNNKNNNDNASTNRNNNNDEDGNNKNNNTDGNKVNTDDGYTMVRGEADKRAKSLKSAKIAPPIPPIKPTMSFANKLLIGNDDKNNNNNKKIKNNNNNETSYYGSIDSDMSSSYRKKFSSNSSSGSSTIIAAINNKKNNNNDDNSDKNNNKSNDNISNVGSFIKKFSLPANLRKGGSKWGRKKYNDNNNNNNNENNKNNNDDNKAKSRLKAKFGLEEDLEKMKKNKTTTEDTSNMNQASKFFKNKSLKGHYEPIKSHDSVDLISHDKTNNDNNNSNGDDNDSKSSSFKEITHRGSTNTMGMTTDEEDEDEDEPLYLNLRLIQDKSLTKTKSYFTIQKTEEPNNNNNNKNKNDNDNNDQDGDDNDDGIDNNGGNDDVEKEALESVDKDDDESDNVDNNKNNNEYNNKNNNNEYKNNNNEYKNNNNEDNNEDHNKNNKEHDNNNNDILVTKFKNNECESLSGDSMRSGGRDSVFERTTVIRIKDSKNSPKNRIWQGASSKNTILNRNHMIDSVDDSQSDADDLSSNTEIADSDNKLMMRRTVFKNILDSESSYLGELDILMKHMTTYKNVASTPQKIIPFCDIEAIFFKIPELHHAHQMFINNLKPKLMHEDSDDHHFGSIFMQLAQAEKEIAPMFLNNYQTAVTTLHRCWNDYPQFAELTKKPMLSTSKESSTLEDLLYNPILRFQRNSFFLQDLIKFTPVHLSDYDLFHKSLKICKSSFENTAESDKTTEFERYLAIQSLIVEKVGSLRKLRHIFLFNDVLVCARQKVSTNKQKISLEVKWHIPLHDLSINDIDCSIEEERLRVSQSEDLDTIQKRLIDLKKELKCETALITKEQEDPQRQWSFNLKPKSQNLEKIKKRILEQQVKLIKTSPHLLFKLHNRKANKTQVLLMASDFERNKWRSTITALLPRAKPSISLSNSELQHIINSQHISASKSLGGLYNFIDYSFCEEHLFGSLNIIIFHLQGLKPNDDQHYYCTVEVDTFGQFLMKAKTRVLLAGKPWNEEFDIELEGTQTLRIHCYNNSNNNNTLVGTLSMELSKAWLRGDFLEKFISINEELSLKISVTYSKPKAHTRRQTNIVSKNGLFGAPIQNTALREGSMIPILIKKCTNEVEAKGMDEVGIYRVSGASGEINKLKKAFEKNSKSACHLLEDVKDIHVVTGLLKTYLRELPESLFTDLAYPKLTKALGLSSTEAKEALISSIVETLPSSNKHSLYHLIDHLIKVSQREEDNKMTLHNLATIFGPTLLRPAKKEEESSQTFEEIFSSSTKEVMLQTQVLLLMLNMRLEQHQQ